MNGEAIMRQNFERVTSLILYSFITFTLLILVGCGGSKMSVMQNTKPLSQSVNRIAIALGSGAFGDAIGIELFNMGFQIVDSNQVAGIADKAGLKESELFTPKGYATFRAEGIEVIIISKAVSVGSTPESANVKAFETISGNLIAGITWQNAWGGQRGSVADRTMRKNISEAAQDITRELSSRLLIKN
jgi:hypothetical protein